MSDKKHSTEGEPSLPRRAILKLIAGLPLALTFGLLASPFLRILLPTRRPLDLLGESDQPLAEPPIPTFTARDFPEPWTCIPLMFIQRYIEYNAEGHEIRRKPGFIMRTEEDKIVAFSRICTYCRHSQPVNFVSDTSEFDYIAQSRTPVLCCPCDFSTFDPNDNGRVLGGPAYRPLRRMTVAFDGRCYKITGIEQGEIA